MHTAQRYYSSIMGRFLTPDQYMAQPVGAINPGNPQSWNKYEYASGDPINGYDPTGQLTVCVGSSLTINDAGSPCAYGTAVEFPGLAMMTLAQWDDIHPNPAQVQDADILNSLSAQGLVSSWAIAGSATAVVVFSPDQAAFFQYLQSCGCTAGLDLNKIITAGVVLASGGAYLTVLGLNAARQLQTAYETYSEKYARCLNKYLAEIKACSEAHPPGPERQNCFDEATVNFNNCMGIGIQ